MSRSIWKGVYIKYKFLKKKEIFFLKRSSSIPKSLLNKSILISNGSKQKDLLVKSFHLNFKAGQFYFTRKFKKF